MQGFQTLSIAEHLSNGLLRFWPLEYSQEEAFVAQRALLKELGTCCILALGWFRLAAAWKRAFQAGEEKAAAAQLPQWVAHCLHPGCQGF